MAIKVPVVHYVFVVLVIVVLCLFLLLFFPQYLSWLLPLPLISGQIAVFFLAFSPRECSSAPLALEVMERSTVLPRQPNIFVHLCTPYVAATPAAVSANGKDLSSTFLGLRAKKKPSNALIILGLSCCIWKAGFSQHAFELSCPSRRRGSAGYDEHI